MSVQITVGGAPHTASSNLVDTDFVDKTSKGVARTVKKGVGLPVNVAEETVGLALKVPVDIAESVVKGVEDTMHKEAYAMKKGRAGFR